MNNVCSVMIYSWVLNDGFMFAAVNYGGFMFAADGGFMFAAYGGFMFAADGGGGVYNNSYMGGMMLSP